MPAAALHSPNFLILGLCAFMGLLSFKPSEPYLSQFLICNKNTQQDFCDSFDGSSSCSKNDPCYWSTSSSSCRVTPCSDVKQKDCGDSSYDYCESANNDNKCSAIYCYKHFSEAQVNDSIYPWSTYAYLPFLLVLGPAAELFSYRAVILISICGRVITRFLLLYGDSLLEMQLMQVFYALGTAAEDGKVVCVCVLFCIRGTPK